MFVKSAVIIIMHILPESKHNELKYSLKIAFMFLSIIVKLPAPNLSILLVIREKATVPDVPWSATEVNNIIGCPVQLLRDRICVDTHLPRFEVIAYVLPHFDGLAHVVIRVSSAFIFQTFTEYSKEACYLSS